MNVLCGTHGAPRHHRRHADRLHTGKPPRRAQPFPRLGEHSAHCSGDHPTENAFLVGLPKSRRVRLHCLPYLPVSAEPPRESRPSRRRKSGAITIHRPSRASPTWSTPLQYQSKYAARHLVHDLSYATHRHSRATRCYQWHPRVLSFARVESS